MKILGLTGGIGMGKSACADLLKQRAIPVVDTDILARDIVRPGQPALQEIGEAFGKEFLGSDGELDRRRLAATVFSDAVARQKLENILHPRIRNLWMTEADKWRTAGHPLGVVVIPLLFETHAEDEFDSVICLACSESTQRQRLLDRGWSLDQISRRINSQWPIEKKVQASNYVIWTEGSLAVHAEQLDCILQKIGGAN